MLQYNASKFATFASLEALNASGFLFVRVVANRFKIGDLYGQTGRKPVYRVIV